MGLATIRNGLVHTLTTCGPFAAREISTCSFSPLTSTTGCAIVLSPGPNSGIEPYRFGQGTTTETRNLWEIACELYILDIAGNEENTLIRAWQAHDDILDTINKDDTLNGTCKFGGMTSFSYNKRQFAEFGGQLWAFVEFTLLAEEFS